MRNVHDVGGQLGYGPVPRDDDGYPFHEKWERLTFGLTLASIANGFLHNLGKSRFANERMRPQDFLGSTYYELWLASLELNLVENGVLGLADIEETERQLLAEAGPVKAADEPSWLTAAIDGMVAHGGSMAKTLSDSRRFGVGNRVLTRLRNTRHHSRLPSYAAGRPATVVGCLPAFPVPEVVAHDLGDTAEWCYRVRFDADALWGEDGHPSDAVYLDVWERDLIPIADEEGASA